jgi:hypothetical protein
MALVTPVPRPLSPWPLCHCCAGVCALSALALSPQASMALHWHCLYHCAGVVALVALALLPLLHPHHCPCHADVFALIALESLPSSLWHCHPMAALLWRLCHNCTGIVAIVVLALLPALCWHCCPCCTCVAALIMLMSLPSLLV